MNMKSRISGLTLIQLLVAMAILAILVLVGIPSLSSFNTNMTIDTVSRRFANAIGFARGEAVNNVGFVSVCAGVNNCDDGTNWSNGWTVFADFNGDGDCAINGVEPNADEILKVGYGSPAVVDVAGAINCFTFNGRGENEGGDLREFEFSSSTGVVTTTKTVTLTRVGYPTID